MGGVYSQSLLRIKILKSAASRWQLVCAAAGQGPDITSWRSSALTLKAFPTGCCRLASPPTCLGSAQQQSNDIITSETMLLSCLSAANRLQCQGSDSTFSLACGAVKAGCSAVCTCHRAGAGVNLPCCQASRIPLWMCCYCCGAAQLQASLQQHLLAETLLGCLLKAAWW